MAAGKPPSGAPSEAAAGSAEEKKVVTPEMIQSAKSDMIRLHSELLAVTRSMPSEGRRCPKGVLFDIMEGVARAAQAYRQAYVYYQQLIRQ